MSERSGAATLTASVTAALLGAVITLSRLGEPVPSGGGAMRIFDVVGVAPADATPDSMAKAPDEPPRSTPPAATPAPAIQDPPEPKVEAAIVSAPASAPSAPALRAEGTTSPLSGAAQASTIAVSEATPGAARSSVSPTQAAADADFYGRLVFREIRARQTFPPELARMGIGGIVVVEFRVSPRGRIIAAAVFLSSQSRQLDTLAVAQVLATPLPAPPRGEARTFRIPMRYQLD